VGRDTATSRRRVSLTFLPGHDSAALLHSCERHCACGKLCHYVCLFVQGVGQVPVDYVCAMSHDLLRSTGHSRRYRKSYICGTSLSLIQTITTLTAAYCARANYMLQGVTTFACRLSFLPARVGIAAPADPTQHAGYLAPYER
jgi:hypothetical protein